MIIEFLVAVGLGGGAVSNMSDTVLSETRIDYTGPVAAVSVYPPEGVLVPQSALPLSPEAQTAFEAEFQADMAYFGAFAIGKDGAYGYVSGANSLDAARDIAFAQCEQYADACLLYAEIHPVGYRGRVTGEVTMSNEATQYYQDPGSRPQFRAMAISEDGAYSFVWGHGSQQVANQTAMTDCQSYRITDLDMRDMPCILLPLK